MPRENIANVPQAQVLTDDEAITLRRIAFGESEVRVLRRADIDRLLQLRLIAAGPQGMVLTRTGKEHFDSLPRASFAARPRRQY
jgi:hypothetical protein